MSGSSAAALIGSYGAVHVPVETLIDRTTGTNIGDMTNNGGLAAAFNGNTNQAYSASAMQNSGLPNYVGKTYSSGKIFSKAIWYGPNNMGTIFGTGHACVINVRGKNGTPSNSADGTLIGTISFNNVSNENGGRTITSTDTSNSYTSLWFEITTSPSSVALCAEAVFYELL